MIEEMGNIFLSGQERPDTIAKQRCRASEKHPDKMIFR